MKVFTNYVLFLTILALLFIQFIFIIRLEDRIINCENFYRHIAEYPSIPTIPFDIETEEFSEYTMDYN